MHRARQLQAGQAAGRLGRPGRGDALVSALVNDASAVVAAFESRRVDDGAASALALLALVAGQDVEPAEGSDGRDGRWRIARRVAEDRVISTVDEQARHTRKSPSARRDGYRAHVVADPETGIITGERLTMACGEENADAAVAAGLAEEAAGIGEEPLAWYGDSAYGTGELRAALAASGQQAVIKPGPLRPAVPGGFTIDDFAVDHAAGTVTCPAGNARNVTRARTVTLGAACRNCPLRGRCTTARDGRTLDLHQHDAILRAARAEWPALREDCKKWRPNVERPVAQVATQRGRRLKLRYRGVTPNDAWLSTCTAALDR